MSWTKDDYPNLMKNLEEMIRIKAINILNAMMEEGYAEENAVLLLFHKQNLRFKM